MNWLHVPFVSANQFIIGPKLVVFCNAVGVDGYVYRVPRNLRTKKF